MPSNYFFHNVTSENSEFMVWRAVAERSGDYTEAGSEFWGFAFNRNARGEVSALLHGPTMKPRNIKVQAGDSSWGVEFPPHVFLRGIRKALLLDVMRPLFVAAGHVEVAGVRVPCPCFRELPAFVESLFLRRVLASDELLAEAFSGTRPSISDRQLRRRSSFAAGLSPYQVTRLQRARHAHRLLHAGCLLAEAALASGYADQAHMTRSFRSIGGLTPLGVLRTPQGPFMSR